MGYIEENLNAGEHLVYQARLHPVIFLKTFLFLIISIIFYMADWSFLGGLLFLIALLVSISPLIKYFTSEYGVTDKRVIVKVGLIRRDSLEILLSKVEGIVVNQGIIDRIVDSGTIVVSGAGSMKELFHNISNPKEFRKKVQERIGKL